MWIEMIRADLTQCPMDVKYGQAYSTIQVFCFLTDVWLLHYLSVVLNCSCHSCWILSPHWQQFGSCILGLEEYIHVYNCSIFLLGCFIMLKCHSFNFVLICCFLKNLLIIKMAKKSLVASVECQLQCWLLVLLMTTSKWIRELCS